MGPAPAIVLALLALAVMTAELYVYGTQISGLVMLAVCIWVAIDSKHVRLADYQSGLAVRPLVLFLLLFFVWPVILPWYLVVRGRIRRGEAPLKPGVAPTDRPAGAAMPVTAAMVGEMPCPRCGAREVAQGAVIGRYCRVCGWRESRG